MNLMLLLIAKDILTKGTTDALQIEKLRRLLYTNGTIDRATANLLIEVYRRVQHRTPAFKQLFYQALKDHLLACERIGDEEVNWLRYVVLAEATFQEEERRFLQEIKLEAKNASPEFEALCQQGMTWAHESSN
jgi:hypothetical protein